MLICSGRDCKKLEREEFEMLRIEGHPIHMRYSATPLQNRRCCGISEIVSRAIQFLKDIYSKISCCGNKKIVALPAIITPSNIVVQPRIVPRELSQAERDQIDIMDLEQVNQNLAGFDAWLREARERGLLEIADA